MIGHVDVTTIAVGGGFWQTPLMLQLIRRAWLFAVLIVALTVGQVPMVGHAASMSRNAAATMHMAGSGSAPCNACDRMADRDDGAACSLPCSNAGPALPVVASPLKPWAGLHFVPMPWSRLPDGRMIPPEPYPPRAFA